MIIPITFKDPDGVYDCVKDAVRDTIDNEPSLSGLSEAERDEIFDSRMDEEWGKLKKWIGHKEYCTVVFDTDKGTAKVNP